MKVLIAYDGSAYADAAIDDLQRAGLPEKVQAIVLDIADVWLPPASVEDKELVFAGLDQRAHARVLEMHAAARAMVADAAVKAQAAAARVRDAFPGWTVTGESSGDSPAWGIIKRADEWPADLIVVGSHGAAALSRFFGSVSQRVVIHALCSVRVARERLQQSGATLRIIAGYDGSTDAETAIAQVASRRWPAGTEVKLVTAVDDRMRTAIAEWILKAPHHQGDDRSWLEAIVEKAAERLRSAGLKTSTAVIDGDPKHVLLNAAQDWQADCIFLGATGLRGLRRILLGSVSSGVTAAAPCSVEVVRPAG